MSGTSIDSIDACLIRFSPALELVSYLSYPISQSLRQNILTLCRPGNDNVALLGETDYLVGTAFADAVNALLSNSRVNPQQIVAIGSHGQTIRHYPPTPHAKHSYTLQIGDPNIIAVRTGCDVVADFRRMDMANGGQAAPLAPLFHDDQFRSKDKNRAVVNLGGIANVSLLCKDKPVTGWDTGPANGLMDQWIQHHRNKPYDKDGEWALTGSIHNALLTSMLDDHYFKEAPPKSTGREHFNLDWINQHRNQFPDISAADTQATLLELTAQSLLISLTPMQNNVDEVYLCGGGAHNKALVARLRELFGVPVRDTAALGIAADWVEAACFAWLANQRIQRKRLSLHQITGGRDAILGGLYCAN